MKFFLTNRSYRKAVLAEASDPSKDPAFLIHRYSENNDLLKRALAASWDVSIETIEEYRESEIDSLVRPLKRAIKAFAEGLAETREGLQ